MGEETETQSDSLLDRLVEEIKNLPSRKDVDIHHELAEHRQLKAKGGCPEAPENHPVAVQQKVESLNEEVLVMEHSLSRERLRRKDVEARLEKAEKALSEVHEDMAKFHEMYGTRVDVWLQSTPQWVRAIYYPVRVLFAGSVAMTVFNVPTALMASAFDWTGFAKLLWFGAVAGFVGFFVFGFLSKLTAPEWVKKPGKKPKKEKEDTDSEDLQTF